VVVFNEQLVEHSNQPWLNHQTPTQFLPHHHQSCCSPNLVK